MTRSAACGFCEVELAPRSTGRPPRFCSTSCRQHDYRERRGVYTRGMSLWRRISRRRWARLCAEFEKRRREDPAGDVSTQREAAREIAVAAWPGPRESRIGRLSWDDYLSSRAIAGDAIEVAEVSSP